MIASGRPVASAVAATATAALLSGCGASDYCSAAEQHLEALAGIRTGGTQAEYEAGAAAAKDLAGVADDDIRPAWKAISDALAGVLEAQAAAGATIEQMNDQAVVRAMDQPLLDAIRAAYAEFDKTAKQRVAVADDIRDDCDLDLQ